MFARLKRLCCFILRRHRYRMIGRDGRVFMECIDCAYRTHGWEVETREYHAMSSVDSFRLWLDDSPEINLDESVVKLPEFVFSTQSLSDLRLTLD